VKPVTACTTQHKAPARAMARTSSKISGRLVSRHGLEQLLSPAMVAMKGPLAIVVVLSAGTALLLGPLAFPGNPADAATTTTSSTTTTTSVPTVSPSCLPDPVNAYDRSVLSSKPWAFYRLDDGPGKVISDSSRTPHDGAYAAKGVEWCATGPVAGDHAVYIPKAVSGIGTGGPGLTGNGSFTLEAWFNSTGLRQNEALLSMGGGNEVGLAIWSGAPSNAFSTLALDEHGNSNLWDTEAVKVDVWDGRWHYLAVSYDARTDEVTAYADARDLGPEKFNRSSLGLAPGPVLLGTWVDTFVNSPFVGEAADLAIYPRVLSPAEVAAHYRASGRGGASSTLSSVASSLPTPRQAFSPITTDLVNAGIAVGAALFITFPANLFNSTFEENYDAIAGWWEKWWGLAVPPGARRRARQAWAKVRRASLTALHLAGRSRKKRLERDEAAFAGVVLVGSLLGSLLDPDFGFNLRSLISFVALTAALVAGIALSGAVTGWYHRLRGHKGTTFRLRALPIGLGVAGFCVAVSRLSGFTPGYLYGVVASAVFSRGLEPQEEGHVAALESLVRVAVGFAAWGFWDLLGSSASRGSFGAVLGQDFFASVFVFNLVGTVISLLPLRFLPGHKLKSWHRGAWAATFALALFVLVQVLLRPRSASSSAHAPLLATVVLFVLFGLGSVLFREHFAHKHRLQAALATTRAATEDEV
jgi:hypothetical protein